MRVQHKVVAGLAAAGLLAAGATRGQEMQMPAPQQAEHQHDQHMHMHMNIPPLNPEYPQMGRAQKQAPGALLTMEQAQGMAHESNPTLKQADSEIRAARARQWQAGLYPNPTVGYTGDEIRGGSVGGGKQGFFIQQAVVTGGKLGLSRTVAAQDVQLALIEAQEQRTRVESAVKIAFLRVLATQELLDARRDLAKIAQDSAETEKHLLNTGQADETEVLDAEVEAHHASMAARMEENTLRQEWRTLAAVIGRPEMPVGTVAGALDRDWPELNEEQAVETIAKESPAVRIATAAAARTQAVLARARKEAVPDVLLRGGMLYNNETLGSVPRAKGWEGIAEVGVQIPIFNHNQGNISGAREDVDRAEQEKRRIALTLRERAASMVDQYANSRLMIMEFRGELLPRAKKSYTLMLQKYGQMLAAYPRVLQTQRKLYELQIEYIGALEEVWTNGIALQGYLLTDGLEAPARPDEMDRPLRETNIPMPERSMMPAGSSIRRP